MNSAYGRRQTWDGDLDEDDETPPLQRWMRLAWHSAAGQLHYRVHSTKLYCHHFAQRPTDMIKLTAKLIASHLLSTTGLLIIIWLFVIYRGEVVAFDKAVSQCDWSNWEQWPEDASPHRVIFIADPQLVDPHTYPGRPWPLSTLTVKHSDLYMRRSYSRIHNELIPDTVIFLGDLFDGGREWSTTSSQSLDERYHGYGEGFWQKEYGRFSKIFLRDWREVLNDADIEAEDSQHTRIIASLPGNHDLGFGQNIQIPVRERFNAFFGESNRVDLIGNHTFVSVDTVSLSAMDSGQSNPEIWQPAYDFLQHAKATRSKMIEKHLHHIDGKLPEQAKFSHLVEDIDAHVAEYSSKHFKGSDSVDIPTILLTHVPLDRSLGKPCGPLRERWPPTPPSAGSTDPVEPDERNSIPSQGYGWQYQNVLSTRISKLITDSLGGTISHVFSGDDHDFCEVTHRGYSSPGAGIKEITVKSLSWTMGVRKPGFLLASLWNDIDNDGRRQQPRMNGDRDTIQTHLCLLPDQISILIRYGILLGISLFFLALQATYNVYLLRNTQPGLRDEDSRTILPTSRSTGSSIKRENMNESYDAQRKQEARSQASLSCSDDTGASSLSVRGAAATRPRSVSPLPLYGLNARPLPAEPLVSYAVNRKGWDEIDTSDDMKWGGMRSDMRKKRPRTPLAKRSVGAQFGILFGEGMWHVARVVLVWYWWLLRR